MQYIIYVCILQELGNPTKFRVENSYGDKEYDKGYLLMSAEWFREFVFEVRTINNTSYPSFIHGVALRVYGAKNG